MFCIASFIVFCILAIFSASYRPLVAKAWHCVVRRVTLRPCDISFGEEVKGRLIGRYVVSHPKFARFLNRWIDVLSFVFVLLSIWSLWSVAMTGLNLWVYDSCNPKSSESCSLSGEACGIEQESLGLMQAIREGRMGEWAINPVADLAMTLSRVPDRLRSWEPSEFLASTATFMAPRDAAKPYALEVIDPSCKFCKKLTQNMQAAGAGQRVNLSYILYPIILPDGTSKFPHSVLLAQYIEATKLVPLMGSPVPGDWRLLDELFAGDLESGTDLQTKINVGSTEAEVRAMLPGLLQKIGYNGAEIERIETLAASADVAAALSEQRQLVEERIRTIKIPTLFLGGRRFDRVITTEKIQSLVGF